MPFSLEKPKVLRLALPCVEGEPARLGGGLVSEVFLGRLKLEGARGKPANLRVAVKVFKDPEWIRGKAGEYSRAMRDLRAAGVPLPKMFIHKLSKADAEGFHGTARAGDYVQVTELYGSRAGSKLGELEYSPQANRKLVEFSTKLANAGYAPEVEDLYRSFRGAVKPVDLDMLVVCGCRPPLRERAQGVLDHIKSLVGTGHSRHDELLAEALKHAEPKLKAQLEKLTAKPEWTREEY